MEGSAQHFFMTWVQFLHRSCRQCWMYMRGNFTVAWGYAQAIHSWLGYLYYMSGDEEEKRIWRVWCSTNSPFICLSPHPYVNKEKYVECRTRSSLESDTTKYCSILNVWLFVGWVCKTDILWSCFSAVCLIFQWGSAILSTIEHFFITEWLCPFIYYSKGSFHVRDER